MPQPTTTSCELCDGSGWRVGDLGASRCPCRIVASRPTATATPVGDAQVDTLAAFLAEHCAGRSRALSRRTIQSRYPELLDRLAVHPRAFERVIRLIAHRASERLVPIVTSDAGYFYALDAEDFDDVIGRIDAQVKHENARLARLRAMRDNMGNR